MGRAHSADPFHTGHWGGRMGASGVLFAGVALTMAKCPSPLARACYLGGSDLLSSSLASQPSYQLLPYPDSRNGFS